MKEALLELCFLGGIFSLGLIAHVIYASIKRFAAAAKEKNHQGIIFELVRTSGIIDSARPVARDKAE